ncbi:MAG: energy-coupling factor transporter ATPase [Bacilli bacterium]|jgi:energy-coupling factor transport system ATP-binding protein|nr:energy-coupling factor transporter ATPase [Bacilli bacterium]MDD2681977.1 energy-coupling factor transporter ATPase [Bacilli bacterium]MDD3120989.1 energy-coupling factor transporter ATPase [Bacilli bacterium]MDD4063163.1 energy-coupling factor transporter ATPase [Bacilli bacterium]MDD4481803.1 energy-coupling factor transporter ATPase [Bacilli bacterium]
MGINFQKVGFYYYTPKKKQVVEYTLSNINLNIEESNEFIAIVGHTGSGKSTLVQLMNALLLPKTGEITIGNKVLTKKTKVEMKPIRKKIGLVFQFPEYQLFEQSVLKDIMFGPRNFGFSVEEANEQAIKMSQVVGLEESLLSRNPFSLSGGQMRKVAIAGILASNPEILIFDEPTVGLDPLAKNELMSLLKKLNDDGKTIIIITHDMEVVSKYCKRVIVMKEGEIAIDTTKDQLFKTEGLLEKYSLDYPILLTLLKKIKEQYNVDLDIYKYNTNDAYLELVRVFGDSYGK